MSYRSLDRLLSLSPELAALSAHAERLMALQRVFAAVVPAYLAEASQVANWRLGTLVIHAANAAVATKLKQLATTLRTAFLRQGMDVVDIQVKVQPIRPHPPQPAPTRQAHVAADARAALTQLGNSLPDDSPLRAALQRLVASAG